MPISPKFEGPLMGIIIALGMGCVMSFVMVAFNVGFTESFLFIWLRAWFIGFLVGFPTAALLVPFARKRVLRVKGNKREYLSVYATRGVGLFAPNPCLSPP